MLVENNQNSMATQEQVMSTDCIIKLNATHNILSIKMQELRFDKETKISSVKAQLEKRFGSPAENITLKLQDVAGAFVVEMSNGDETLQHYGAVTGFNIHVVDNQPSELIQSFDDMT